MNTLVRISDVEKKANEIGLRFEDSNFMYKHVPALFATTAHPNMSQRYAFTNTYDILMHMHRRGFGITSVMGGTSMYNKVMVRMRNPDYGSKNGDAPEFLVLDSHDGTSPIKLLLGFIRGACLNGCIAGDMLYARSFRHTAPDLMDQIYLELRDIDTHVRALVARIDAMRGYKTTIGEQLVLADAAIKARYGDDKDASFIADMRKLALNVRRTEDKETDLYTIMNVVQENIIRGGLAYVNSNRRLQRMRTIGAVDRNLHINQRIWLEAERIMSHALEVEASYDEVVDVE
jgi:hypothetical protein